MPATKSQKYPVLQNILKKRHLLTLAEALNTDWEFWVFQLSIFCREWGWGNSGFIDNQTTSYYLSYFGSIHTGMIDIQNYNCFLSYLINCTVTPVKKSS